MSLVSLFKKFPTEESCIEYLEKIRFAKGRYCVYCGSKKVCNHNLIGSKTRNSNRLQCQSCHKSFSVTVNTIFHRTHLDLRHWFYIIFLMLNAKKGISACQVARDLGIRRPTVWAIMHKIRKAMATEQKELLEGIFEMDETYIKSKNDDKDDNDLNGTGRRENNTSVVGIKQKGGVIKAFATHNTTTTTLLNLALRVAKRGSEIHTDEYNAYTKFSEFYKHKKVKHAVEYVTADGIHCNGVESFWALLKRGIKGQFHHLSKKYLQNYIDEFEFRYNHKTQKDLGMSEVVGRMLFV